MIKFKFLNITLILIFSLVVLSLSLENTHAEQKLYANLLEVIGGDGSFDYTFVMPKAISINDASQIYIVNRDNHQIQIFSDQEKISDFIIDDEFDTRHLSDGLDVFEDKVYVADHSENEIKIFSLSGILTHSFGQKGSENGEFNLPVDVAVGSDGRIYVADLNNHRIQIFTGDGNYVSSIGQRGFDDDEFHNPTVLEVDKNNRIYVSDNSKDTVRVFENDGSFLFKFGKFGVHDNEFLNREVTVFDESNGQKSIYSRSDRHTHYPLNSAPLIYGEITENHLYIDPSVIRIDKDGITYTITDRYGQNTVFVNDSKLPISFGEMKRDDDGEFKNITGITVDDNGWIYVVDRFNNEIRIFSERGIPILSFGEKGKNPGQFFAPYDVAVSDDGFVYVSDQNNNRIQKFEISDQKTEIVVKENPSFMQNLTQFFEGLFGFL